MMIPYDNAIPRGDDESTSRVDPPDVSNEEAPLIPDLEQGDRNDVQGVLDTVFVH